MTIYHSPIPLVRSFISEYPKPHLERCKSQGHQFKQCEDQFVHEYCIWCGHIFEQIYKNKYGIKGPIKAKGFINGEFVYITLKDGIVVTTNTY